MPVEILYVLYYLLKLWHASHEVNVLDQPLEYREDSSTTESERYMQASAEWLRVNGDSRLCLLVVLSWCT